MQTCVWNDKVPLNQSSYPPCSLEAAVQSLIHTWQQEKETRKEKQFPYTDCRLGVGGRWGSTLHVFFM